MLSLESDKTYRLNPVSAISGDDGKVYIHVKFTDSSFKSIEEYAARIYNVKKGLGQNTNLSIDFAGDQGHFDVPTSGNSPGESNNSNNVRRFQFQLAPSSTSEGGSSSFECFQQKKLSDGLAAFGAFARRLTVKAQEDVFDATRERMAAVAEESEKNRARRIEAATSSGTLKGVARRGASIGQPSSSSRPSAAAQSASQATTAASLFDAASLAKRKAAERLSSLQHKSTTPGGSASAAPATGGSSSSTQKTTPTSQQQPREQQHSLRERILYSLAIKPQTEQQLISGLKLSNREAIDLTPIVKQLCYTPGGNGVFHLRRDAYSNVKFDHPLVGSHEDKMAIRRNANASATMAPSLPTLTPPSNSSSSSQQQQQQKPQRPPPTSVGDHVPPKMRKLEDSSSSQQPQKAPVVSSTAPINVKTRPAYTQVSSSSSSSSRVVNGMNKAAGSFNSSPNKDSNSGLMDVDFGSRSHDGSKNYGVVTSSGSTSSSPEIPVIENREQRSAMKADFMVKYAEYRKLHETLSDKTAYLREMRPRLEACEPDSEQYHALEEAIRDAYAKLQEDKSYETAKRKLDELHVTLAKIKQAIEDYDIANASSGIPCSGTSSGGSQAQSSSSTSSSPAVTSTGSML